MADSTDIYKHLQTTTIRTITCECPGHPLRIHDFLWHRPQPPSLADRPNDEIAMLLHDIRVIRVWRCLEMSGDVWGISKKLMKIKFRKTCKSLCLFSCYLLVKHWLQPTWFPADPSSDSDTSCHLGCWALPYCFRRFDTTSYLQSAPNYCWPWSGLSSFSRNPFPTSISWKFLPCPIGVNLRHLFRQKLNEIWVGEEVHQLLQAHGHAMSHLPTPGSGKLKVGLHIWHLPSPNPRPWLGQVRHDGRMSPVLARHAITFLWLRRVSLESCAASSVAVSNATTGWPSSGLWR